MNNILSNISQAIAHFLLFVGDMVLTAIFARDLYRGPAVQWEGIAAVACIAAGIVILRPGFWAKGFGMGFGTQASVPNQTESSEGVEDKFKGPNI